ncbi:MAG: nicotinamide-nucleotide amidohydrolase family protein [Actinomycetota bacterium]|nr:nicotinamide-nucleotide amidohydrolase family protein [Actinomycetota bacterium]
MQSDLIWTCRSLGLTLATAESLTAGLVCSMLAEVPGASAVLRGGVTTYATDTKASVLGLDLQILDHVVSEPVVHEMARAACRLYQADLGLATTGVAGPDSLDGQPAGTVWIAVYDARAVQGLTRLLALPGGRAEVRQSAAEAVIALAAEYLAQLPRQGRE